MPNGRRTVDEAYVDYVAPDESLEQAAARSSNLLVCKSMSKANALSGARVGYLCGPPVVIRDLSAVTPPWVVGLPSQFAAVLALRDPEYYAARYHDRRRLRLDLAQVLRELGLFVWPGVTNFLLCRVPAAAGGAAGLTNRCRRHGLFIRNVSSMASSAAGELIRVAVKDPATNARMIEVLKDELIPEGFNAGHPECRLRLRIC